MSNVAISPLFASLQDSEKEFINHSIEFLYRQHHEDFVDEETQKAIDNALAGNDIYGPFDTIEELKEALNA